MGKICKYANIYSTEKDNNGEYKVIRKVNNNGVLEDYTMEELEQLVDDLGNDKDEDGKIKNKLAFNNASSMLFQYYQKYGNPHEKDIIEALKNKPRSIDEQKQEALSTVMDEYTDYEEVAA